MENPFYNDELRPLSGLTDEVRKFVLDKPQTQQFLTFLRQFFAFAVPAYQAEGKTRLTVAIGCTGGFHRSIAIAEAIAADLRAAGKSPVSVWHRELDRE
jgi:RNase adapter protein RapZ